MDSVVGAASEEASPLEGAFLSERDHMSERATLAGDTAARLTGSWPAGSAAAAGVRSTSSPSSPPLAHSSGQPGGLLTTPGTRSGVEAEGCMPRGTTNTHAVSTSGSCSSCRGGEYGL